MQKLTKQLLQKAQTLRDKVFKDKDEAFIASLTPNHQYYKKHNITKLEYFVKIKDNEVIGTIGLYEENNETWLGWFCVDERYRNQGIGQEMFDFILKKASKLKIYTDKDNFVAQKFYEKNGFKKFYEDKKNVYYKN